MCAKDTAPPVDSVLTRAGPTRMSCCKTKGWPGLPALLASAAAIRDCPSSVPPMARTVTCPGSQLSLGQWEIFAK